MKKEHLEPDSESQQRVIFYFNSVIAGKHLNRHCKYILAAQLNHFWQLQTLECTSYFSCSLATSRL